MGAATAKLGRGLLLAAALALAACAKPLTNADFVGKWRSSKLSTPLHLHDNGEWEIKLDDGTVLQYGVWRYEGNQLVWTFKMRSSFLHDANEVLAFTPREFQLREADGSVTTFTRLD